MKDDVITNDSIPDSQTNTFPFSQHHQRSQTDRQPQPPSLAHQPINKKDEQRMSRECSASGGRMPYSGIWFPYSLCCAVVCMCVFLGGEGAEKGKVLGYTNTVFFVRSAFAPHSVRSNSRTYGRGPGTTRETTTRTETVSFFLGRA